MNTLIVKIIISIALIFGGYSLYQNHNNMVATIAQQKLTISTMEKTHAEYKRATERRIDKLKEDVFQSQKATKEAMKLYTDTLSKYEKDKKELNEKAANLDKLINDYGLYDPFATLSSAGSDSNRARQGIVQKADFSVTSSGDYEASNGKLSTGLIQYLSTRTKEADQVVLQLKTVQGYAIGQHKWILENCNAEEVK